MAAAGEAYRRGREEDRRPLLPASSPRSAPPPRLPRSSARRRGLALVLLLCLLCLSLYLVLLSRRAPAAPASVSPTAVDAIRAQVDGPLGAVRDAMAHMGFGALSAGIGRTVADARSRSLPPLAVLAVLPENNAVLRRRDAVHVVFSRPVVALGERLDGPPRGLEMACGDAVPGRWRAASTSVLRFDPAEEWPPGLACRLTAGAALTSPAGARLAAPVARAFATRALSFSLGAVESPAAANATGGTWAARGPGRRTPEVPPDATVQLRFSDLVDPQRVRDALRLEEDAADRGAVPVRDARACPGTGGEAHLHLTRCVLVTPGPGWVRPGRKYRAVLHAGARLHPAGGPLPAEQALSFSGLLPFRVRFRKADAVRGSSRLLAVSLPLGLERPRGMPDGVAAAFSVERASGRRPEPVTAVHRVSSHRLVLETPYVLPGERFRVRVAASPGVRDAFGQAMEASESPWLTARGVTDVLAAARPPSPSVSVTPDGGRAVWPVLARSPKGGKKPPAAAEGHEWSLRLFAVPDEGDLLARALSVAITGSDENDKDLAAMARGESASSVVWGGLAKGPASLLALEPPPGWRGVVLLRRSRADWPAARWSVVSFGGLGLAAAATDAGPGLTALSLWVTDAAGDGVAGATVRLFASAPGKGWRPSGVRRVPAVYTADESGLVHVPGPRLARDLFAGPLGGSPPPPRESAAAAAAAWHFDLSAVVVAGGGASVAAFARVLPGVVADARRAGVDAAGPPPPAPAPRLAAVMVTDMAMYRRADAVRVKGFVRESRGDGGEDMAVPGPVRAGCEVRARWPRAPGAARGRRAEAADATARVTLAPGTGSFAAELRVPADSPVGRARLTLVCDTEAGVELTGVWLTVAVPRAPTAELEASTHAPGGAAALLLGAEAEAEVRLRTLSSTGSPHAGARVSVRWEVEGVRGAGGAPARLNGTAEAQTDRLGRATAAVPLGALAGEALTGGTLRVEATWVGPTRERLVRRASLPLAASPWEVRLRLSSSGRDVTPGIPFWVSATVRDLLHDGPPPAAARVRFALYRWEGDERSEAEAAALAAEPFRFRGAVVRDRALDGRRFAVPAAAREAAALVASRGMELVRECSTGGVPGERCEMTLPSQGRFVVVTTARPAAGGEERGVAAEAVGRTELEWEQSPAAELPAAALPSFRADNASVSFRCPFAGASLWLSQGGGVVATGLSAGPHTVPLDGCQGGCDVVALLLVPGGDREARLAGVFPVPVPVSPLLDPGAPRVFAAALHVDAPTRADDSLTVTLGLPATEMRPGEGGAANVRVADAQGRPVAGEVSLWAVDVAWLGLAPVDAPGAALADRFRGSTVRRAPLLYSSHDRAQLSAWQLRRGAELTLGRLREDPGWPSHDDEFSVRPGSDLDRSDDLFWLGTASDITEGGGGGMWPGFGGGGRRGGGGIMFKHGGPMAMMMKTGGGPVEEGAMLAAEDEAGDNNDGGGGGGGNAGSAPRLRTSFVVNPVFVGRAEVGADGTARLPFTLPDNIGQFEFRALAAAPTNRFGGGTARVVVRQPVNTQPSVPAAVRLDDVFLAGVTVAAGSGRTARVRVRAEARCAALVAADSDRAADVTVDGEQPREVLFSWRAVRTTPGALPCALRFVVLEAGAAGDALEANVTVLPTRDPVTLGTCMAVRGAGPSPVRWTEGIALPDAEPGTGRLTVTVGLGHLPAVRAAAAGAVLAAAASARPRPSARNHLAALAAVAADRVYGDSRVLGGGGGAVLKAAAAALAALTSPRTGLRRSPGGRASRADPYLCAEALLVARDVSAARGHAPLLPGDAELGALTASWRSGLAAGLAELCELSRRNKAPISARLLALVLLAGAEEAVPSRCRVQGDALAARAASPGIALAADVRAALAMRAARGGDAAAARAVLVPLRSLVRVQGRTAYLATGAGEASAARDAVQAAALRAFAEAGAVSAGSADLQLFSKVAAYVGGDRGAESGARAPGLLLDSPAVSAAVLAALSSYDARAGNARPDLSVSASLGGSQLIAAAFGEPGSDAREAVVPWEKVRWLAAGAPPLVTVSTTGRGEASVAVGMRFVPADLSRRPVYRGLAVERFVGPCGGGEASSAAAAAAEEEEDDDATPRGTREGLPVADVPLGSLLCVTVQVVSADDLRGVLVTDLLPGGVEAVDPLVPGSSAGDAGPLAGSGIDFWLPPPPPPAVDTDRVTFYVPWMRAGAHEFRYRATAATPGTFLYPPCSAAAEDQQALSGLSGASVLKIS